MKIADLVTNAWYVSNGYIDSFESIELLEGYILYNLSVLNKFERVVVATTYKEQSEDLINANCNLWKKYFKNCVTIDLKENRGHGFGIADSENALIEYCKENGVQWICKSSNDVLIKESLLDTDIEADHDFYYLNGISYEDLYLNGFDYEKIYKEHFYPQTNFYFIRTDKIDYLYDRNYVNETYEYRLTIPNYNNKIWEYIPEWSCENFLKKCVNRNGLNKRYLLNKEQHNILCELIKNYKIGDPSHKNIMIKGICHFQFPEQPILEI
jgi:hypothetical protein